MATDSHPDVPGTGDCTAGIRDTDDPGGADGPPVTGRSDRPGRTRDAGGRDRTARGTVACRTGRAVRRRLRLPRTRKGRRRAVRLLVLVCVAALLPATWLRLTTGDQLARTAAEAPTAPVAVVFGAGLWDGEPSPYLAHRLDTAAELYSRDKVRVILVTGDNSTHDYDEPSAMRRYLAGHGVPRSRIVADHAGFDTWDSCTRAARIFGVRRALLVSQDFHIRRAVALCEAAGIQAYGVPVTEPRDLTWYGAGLRELPAAAKAAFDAAFTPDPRFLGPREDGIGQALADAEEPEHSSATQRR